MLLADNDGAAVENDNELFLPGNGAAAVGLASAMTEAAFEDDRTEPGLDVLENAHILNVLMFYHEFFGDLRRPIDGLKFC